MAMDLSLRMGIGAGGASGPAAPALITIALAGSSTPDQYTTLSSGASNADVSKSTDGVTFAQATAGVFIMDAGNAIATATGGAVRWIAKGVGGTTVAGWASDSGSVRTNLINAINAAGGCDYLYFQCGWNDANTEAVVSLADHTAKLRSIFAAIRTGTALPNLKILIGLSQRALTGASATAKAQLTTVHDAELTVAQDANNYLILNTIDLATSDGVHQTPASQATSALRVSANVLRLINNQAVQVGPSITAATRVDDTHTDFTVSHSGGTDFTPTSAITGARVLVSGTPLALSAIARLSATVFRATHATSGGNAGTADYVREGFPDVSAILYDNNTPPRPALPSAVLTFAAGPDTTPDAFTFTDQTDVAQSTVIESAAITVAGITSASVITITGGEYQINGGAWTSSAGTVVNGDAVKARVTSSGAYSSAASAVVTIGGVSDTFTATTLADPGGGTKTVRTAYAAVGATTPTGWNAQYLPAGGTPQPADPLTPLALNKTDGAASGWTETISPGPNQAGMGNGMTTGADTGVFPDAVLLNSWFNSRNSITSTDQTPVTTHTWSGLDPAKLYDFKIGGYRNASGRSTSYTINGVTQSMSVQTTSGSVSFTDIAPTAGGEIVMSWTRTDSGSLFGYLSAIEIIEHS